MTIPERRPLREDPNESNKLAKLRAVANRPFTRLFIDMDGERQKGEEATQAWAQKLNEAGGAVVERMNKLTDNEEWVTTTAAPMAALLDHIGFFPKEMTRNATAFFVAELMLVGMDSIDPTQSVPREIATIEGQIPSPVPPDLTGVNPLASLLPDIQALLRKDGYIKDTIPSSFAETVIIGIVNQGIEYAMNPTISPQNETHLPSVPNSFQDAFAEDIPGIEELPPAPSDDPHTRRDDGESLPA